jgi:hypothetical protein
MMLMPLDAPVRIVGIFSLKQQSSLCSFRVRPFGWRFCLLRRLHRQVGHLIQLEWSTSKTFCPNRHPSPSRRPLVEVAVEALVEKAMEVAVEALVEVDLA